MIHDGAFPDTIKDPQVKKLLEDYLHLSNAANPKHPSEADEEGFAALFSQDGVYQLASKSAKGPKAIVEMRKEIFAHVPHRDHRAIKFFTFGTDERHLMVEGEVFYEHHKGHKTETSWAARLKIKDEGGKAKFELLQIIVDTAAHA